MKSKNAVNNIETKDPFGIDWRWLDRPDPDSQLHPKQRVISSIESAIFRGDDGFLPGARLKVATILPLIHAGERSYAEESLDALVDFGVLDSLSQSQIDLPSREWSVPQIDRRVPSNTRWIYWERYHHEVVFACLLISKPLTFRAAAVAAIRNEMEVMRKIVDSNCGVDVLIKQDRKIHLTICYYGACIVNGEKKNDSQCGFALRNLERSFNRLSAALPANITASRVKQMVIEHEAIVDALDTDVPLPGRREFTLLLDAYRQHFFYFGKEYLQLSSKFLDGLGESVLRETEALECLEPTRFFRGAKLLVYRSKELLPQEWGIQGGESNILFNEIASAVVGGMQLHYVCSDSIDEVQFSQFEERLVLAVRGLLEGKLRSDRLPETARAIVTEQVFLFLACNGQAPFISEVPDFTADGIFLYQGSYPEFQFTIRTCQASERTSEIQRRIDASEKFMRQYLIEYSEFLRTLDSAKQRDIALQKIQEYLSLRQSRC